MAWRGGSRRSRGNNGGSNPKNQFFHESEKQTGVPQGGNLGKGSSVKKPKRNRDQQKKKKRGEGTKRGNRTRNLRIIPRTWTRGTATRGNFRRGKGGAKEREAKGLPGWYTAGARLVINVTRWNENVVIRVVPDG